ncbi:MAG TPA: hypothetical protein VLA61_25180 [Ideonella sp.]|uniref:hypothetical protein n=1 Tax=Ideonella sp. TaxID=1929293 RepID=UPI002BB1091F|nr:hypothetical protein [Ideonella sp.]HSI51576.1 hypothetical protein [Ideonella sp.]
MKTTRNLIAVAALSVLASAASAKIIASGNYPFNFSYAVNPTFLPLSAGGATTFTFNATKAGRYVLTFSGECSTDAPAGNTAAWVEIDLVVNGVTVAPTVGTSDAFCGANGTLGFDGWVRPSITTVVSLLAGANTLRIKGGFQAGATAGWLSDTSWVIHQ